MFPRPRATAAAAVAALLAIVPASAARAVAEPSQPHGELMLTVSDAEDTWTRGVMLTCPDQGGPHPRAAEACAALDHAEGEFRALSGRDRNCTAQHEPVVATASGTWRGKWVKWRGEFPNACALARQTGVMFDF
ncbi:SSI family serine proteinase inhibitor [Streptomyces macrosporus]|uniref:SSI family serine proteinase inhibitor n=1 Tax=Streptomyces macrosporus TaxID=44032 RepID=A0ABN3K470_9ACTN